MSSSASAGDSTTTPSSSPMTRSPGLTTTPPQITGVLTSPCKPDELRDESGDGPTECRKLHVLDGRYVARRAVDDPSLDPKLQVLQRAKLAEARVLGVAAAIDDDHIARSHQVRDFVEDACIDAAWCSHGQCGTDQSTAAIHGLDAAVHEAQVLLVPESCGRHASVELDELGPDRAHSRLNLHGCPFSSLMLLRPSPAPRVPGSRRRPRFPGARTIARRSPVRQEPQCAGGAPRSRGRRGGGRDVEPMSAE